MEIISASEFMQKLSSGDMVPACTLMGFVKQSGNDSGVLFSFKHDMANWFPIPASIIASVRILKSIPMPMGSHQLTLVKLRLKTPSQPDTRLLYDLLAILSAKVNKYYKKKWMKKMLMEDHMKEHGMHMMHMHGGHQGPEGWHGHHCGMM